MPCIFCIAVFAMLAGAVTTAVLDQLEERLGALAAGPVARTVDTGSVAKFELDVVVPPEIGRGTGVDKVPVAISVFKAHKRVRFQVLTHALARPQVEALEDHVAATLGLTIVDRSTEADEAPVRRAMEAQPSTGDDAPADARPTARRLES